MNVSDSELVEALLIKQGYKKVNYPNKADILFVNTCSIREHAEDKVHSRLGFYNKLKKDNPEIIIGVLGCMAQNLKDNILQNKTYVDIVLGPDSYRKIVDFIHQAWTLALEVQSISGPKFVTWKQELETNISIMEKVSALKQKIEAYASKFPLPGHEDI